MPNWPPLEPFPAAGLGAQLEWVRARVLYSFCPADRDVSYAIRHARWMLIVPFLLVCPFIADFMWTILLTVILSTRKDPYQLMNGVWLFKVRCSCVPRQ